MNAGGTTPYRLFILTVTLLISHPHHASAAPNLGDVSVVVVVFDIIFSLIVFLTALYTMLSLAFSGQASLKKVTKMGIADGDYTMDGNDIIENAQKKEALLWWSSVPISIIVPLVLIACGIYLEGGVTPHAWIITVVCAVIAAIVFNQIKYSCPNCSAILEHASFVEEDPTDNNEEKTRLYLACHKCGNKYVGDDEDDDDDDDEEEESEKPYGHKAGHHSHTTNYQWQRK